MNRLSILLLSCVSMGSCTVLYAQDAVDVHLIWSNLLRASANFEDFPPKLVITSNDASGPAYYSKKENAVFLHNSLQDTLRSILGPTMAAKGLGYVLAHELAHVTEKHITTHFVRRSLRGSSALTHLRENKAAFSLLHETDADRLAGVYAHIIGMNCLESAPLTLDAIYAAYDIPDSIPGYPSLSERKAIAQRVAEQMEDVSLLYDAALFAIALGFNEQAVPLLETLLRDANYKAFEVYDLLALAHFNAGLKSYGDQLLSSWQFPIHLSTRPLSNRLTRAIHENQKEGAIESFELAIKWGLKGDALKRANSPGSGIVESARWAISYAASDEKMRETLIGSVHSVEMRSIFQALEWAVDEKFKKASKLLTAANYTVYSNHALINHQIVQAELGGKSPAQVSSQCLQWSSGKREALAAALFSEFGFKSLKLGSTTILRVKKENEFTLMKLPASFDQTIAFWDSDSLVTLPCGFEFGTTVLQEALSLWGAQASIIQLTTSTMVALKSEGLLFHFGMDEKLRSIVWLVD